MFLILIVLFSIVFLWNGVRHYNYWISRGVKHVRTLPYLGTNARQYFQQASIAMLATETYRKFPEEKVVGFYRGLTPELVIRDPEIIKRILVTDFHHFYPRGLNPHDKVVEPMLKNLFFADGDLWKLLRQRITPAFSTGKLKAMFPMITERAEKLKVLAEEMASSSSTIDARDLMARYTTDFIGACGFGINIDSLSERNSQFRKLGKRIFYRSPRDALACALKEIFPELCKHVHYLSPEIEQSMTQLVDAVVKERGYKPSGRNDFIDLMLELKQAGSIVGESIERRNPDGSPVIVKMDLDDLLLTAQVFVFFGAGFETSSSASSYTLHQLAFNPVCQQRVQKEIDSVLTKHGNRITYDAVKEMTYLEMAFAEAMRMFPSPAYLLRKCASPEYTFPELGITITKGVQLMIPIQALQNDEKYFENPETFDPERFDPEIRKTVDKFVYLPFGEGPRACVGLRLGQMQSLAGLVAILQKFTVEPAANSLKTPIADPRCVIAENFLGGLPLILKRRNQ